MKEKLYRLLGEIRIPEEKKTLLNGYVLQILQKCGIRKTEEIQLAGHQITVVRKPEPDENGIVCFDYSIFEKKKREKAFYNTSTCELTIPDCGYAEYGLVMNMIMVLLESYSETPCYLLYKDRISSVDGYAAIIKDILHIDIQFPHRLRTEDEQEFKRTEYKFYRAIRRDDEDEFIEFWNSDDMIFSDEMKETMQIWSEQYRKMDDEMVSRLIMEDILSELVFDLENTWKCRLVDKSFVDEFLMNADKHEYKKALVVFRELLDEPMKYFPELTKKQAIKWIVYDSRPEFDFIAMSAFQSLLINHQHRQEVLGF